MLLVFLHNDILQVFFFFVYLEIYGFLHKIHKLAYSYRRRYGYILGTKILNDLRLIIIVRPILDFIFYINP